MGSAAETGAMGSAAETEQSVADTASKRQRARGWRRLRRILSRDDLLPMSLLIKGTPLDETMALRLLQEGRLPVYALPKADTVEGNGIKQVFIAEYENGVEFTVVFMDEDRPSKLTDAVYDALRKRLFGRVEDIETHFVNGASPDALEFPGTYSANFDWNAAAPLHGTVTVPLDRFEQRVHSSCMSAEGPVVWTNTWSHLFGEKNANPEMEMCFYSAAPQPSADGADAPLATELTYPLFHGSRDEVDRRFKGLIKSFKSTTSPEKRAMLGARLNKPEPLGRFRAGVKSAASLGTRTVRMPSQSKPAGAAAKAGAAKMADVVVAMHATSATPEVLAQ